MRAGEQDLLSLLSRYRDAGTDREELVPIVYTCSRIKSPDSMIRKLTGRGLPPTPEAALGDLYDGIGVRAVCAFTEDGFRLVRWLREQPLLEIVKEKNYYEYPKPNGYRSYHLLVRLRAGEATGLHAEIQVRTVADDFRATLEHQLQYKKDLPSENLIRRELKRCADEIASVDISMQTLWELIRGTGECLRERGNRKEERLYDSTY